MERLTRHIKSNDPKTNAEIIKCKAALCGTICEKVTGCDSCPINEAINKLAKFEDLEEKQLLLYLPCKPGNTVYFIHEAYINKINPIIKMIVITVETKHHNGITFLKLRCVDPCDYEEQIFTEGDIGKTVFLSMEEAKEALQKTTWIKEDKP